MPKISIRFCEEPCLRRPIKKRNATRDLLVSLGLESEEWGGSQDRFVERWREAQVFDSDRWGLVSVFGVMVPIPRSLKALSQWVCRLEERDGAMLLSVGGCHWAASILDPDALPPADDLIWKDITVVSVDTYSIGQMRFSPRVNALGLRSSRAALDINYPPADLTPVSEFASLRSLSLRKHLSLRDIMPLHSLRKLETLDLSGCKSLTDLSPLAGLASLRNLNLSGCESLTDLTPLAGLHALSSLALRDCKSLEDLSPLAGLASLRCLDCYNCKSLMDLAPLAGLHALASLDLGGCGRISDLSNLAGLHSLQSLEFTSRRIRSIEPLRKIPSLRALEEFNPSEVAELLAHTSILRVDRSFIHENSKAWLNEAKQWRDASLALQDRFAATLGNAFSLMSGDSITTAYEEYLDSRPDFSSSPWKAWFGGTLKESGFDLYRQRVERVPVSKMLPGAIGGACATLPIDEQSEWSRRWLAHLEKERLADAKSLLSVAPEICLAYARADEREALARWLERFTDPSDPGALDPVHVALGKLKLGNGEFDAAQAYIFAVQSPASRDPLLVDLVSALASSNQDRASMALLLIEEPSLRSRASKILAIHPPLSETTIHRLVVSTGDSPQALADLITVIPAASDSELLRKISQGLQPERKAVMRAVAAELHDYADRLLAEADNAD